MKKQILAITALAVVSAPAFASKARLQALGENIADNVGSLYFSDNRNIFQNPAYANEYKNQIFMEWGKQGVTQNQIAANTFVPSYGDTDTSPQAEGGFLYGHGNYVYGIHLGAESPYTNEIRSYTRSLKNDGFQQDNQIDAFFAGESSALGKWGLNLTYSNSEDESQDAEQKSLSVRLGMIKGKTEAFLNVALMSKAESGALGATLQPTGTGTDEFEAKLGFEAGLTQDVDFAKAFVYVRHAKWEHDTDSLAATGATAFTGKFDGTYWMFQGGLGKEHKVNEKATLFAKAEYLKFIRNVEVTSSGADKGKEAELNDWNVPVAVGLEYDALSWLTLRGSVKSNLAGDMDNDYDGVTGLSPGVKAKRPEGKRTIANSTNVNAGMTIKFGELSIDGVIGTSNNGTVESTKSNSGNLSFDNLASRVSMNYRF